MAEVEYEEGPGYLHLVYIRLLSWLYHNRRYPGMQFHFDSGPQFFDYERYHSIMYVMRQRQSINPFQHHYHSRTSKPDYIGHQHHLNQQPFWKREASFSTPRACLYSNARLLWATVKPHQQPFGKGTLFFSTLRQLQKLPSLFFSEPSERRSSAQLQKICNSPAPSKSYHCLSIVDS